MPAPPIRTVLSALDTAGKHTMQLARDAGVPAYAAALPSHSGTLRRDVGARVSRFAGGYRLTIGPRGKMRYRGRRGSGSGVSTMEVYRFVGGGTGLYGPRRQAIRGRRGPMVLPNGAVVRVIAGQRPQHLADATERAADPVVTAIIRGGANRAARAVQAVL